MKINPRIISIVGARPQFIKASIVSKKLRENEITEKVIHTGQHYDFNMADIFFKELNISVPNFNLKIGSAPHGEQTGQMIAKIEKVLLKEKPDFVIVYGDTNTTLAGALAASKLHIPIGHVEAGLRSFNKKMPEEINRIVTDHVSDILFSPTETGLQNLKKEGFPNIFYSKEPLPNTPYPLPLSIDVGDVMFDIALSIKDKIEESKVLTRYRLKNKDFILATIHRPENTDNKGRLKNIWNAMIEIAEQGKTIFAPLHPRTRKMLELNGFLDTKIPRKLIIGEPISYFDMIALESNARVILTDSGGVQKEGYFFKIPCVIVREQTEWVELVNLKCNVLTGANRVKIISSLFKFWSENYFNREEISSIFGNGNASGKIVEIIKNFIQ